MTDKHNSLKINPVTAKVAFEICKSEYENERKRTNTIDTKASIVVALMGAVIPFAVQSKISICSHVFENKGFFAGVVFIISFLALIIFSLCALFFMFKTISKRNYYALDVDYFTQWEHLQVGSTCYYLTCALFYNKTTNTNRKVNDTRIKDYQCSLRFIGASIVSFLMFNII